MGKPNAMIAKIEAKYTALFHRRMDMILQMGQDAAMMAAHDVLNMGPGRAVQFCVAYREAMNEMARLVVDDQQDDREFWYVQYDKYGNMSLVSQQIETDDLVDGNIIALPREKEPEE